MIFYLEFSHNRTKEDHVIADSMEIHIQNGSVINASWDVSEWTCEDEKTTSRLKKVRFNDVYANGRIKELINGLKRICLNLNVQNKQEDVLVSDIYLTVVDSGKFEGFRFFGDGRLMYKMPLEG